MTDTIKEYCQRITELAQQRKQEACTLNRGVADIASFVSLNYENDIIGTESESSGNPIQHLPETLDALLKTGIVKFDHLAFTAEVYVKKVADSEHLTQEQRDEILNRYKHGDLRKEYEENPATDIVEGLFTTVIDWEGNTHHSFTEVKYDDKGQPVFTVIDGSTQKDSTGTLTQTTRLSGVVSNTLNDYRIYCHNLITEDGGKEYADAFHELYKEMGNLRDAVEYIKNLRENENE